LLKTTFLVLVLLVRQGPAMAQLSLGIEGGLDRNHLITGSGYRANTLSKSVDGAVWGMQADYRFPSSFSIAAGLAVLAKNASVERDGYYQGIYQAGYNEYIQLPLMAGYSATRGKMRFAAYGGGFVAYWITGRIKGTIPNIGNLYPPPGIPYTGLLQDMRSWSYDQKYAFSSTDRRVGFGFAARVSIDYRIDRKVGIFLAACFYDAWTDQQKKYAMDQQTRLNETYALTAGCRVEL
jgi:hypothetical protein